MAGILWAVRPLDVRHQGRERVICCWQVGDVLVDPGPESALGTLVAELGEQAPRALLLTHIHLDHAGASGAIVRRWPQVQVYVHEVGAPHLVDPSKLVASARRLYGEDMQRLWGEVVPIPQVNVHALSGGEQVEGFRVAYTPGHASHHVSYLHEESGRAFVGDVAGVRIPPADLVLPPTPPPDIDIDAWNESISRVAEWRPRSLGLTHFGAVHDPFEHLAEMRDALARWATLARELDAPAFEQRVREEMAGAPGEDTRAAYLEAMPPDQHWHGLQRYWRKREEAAA
jgi:glyoxylase-like metal-dependent hydrolase (beta-lactamase superfamily II)